MEDKNQSGTIYVSVNDTSRNSSTDSNRSSSSGSSSGPPSFVDDLARKSSHGIEIGQSNGIDPRPPKRGSPGAGGINSRLINTTTLKPYHLPLYRKLAYGVGHVFNDMCASMWFTYLLVFFHFVVRINNAYAGLLLLIGQVADASATPIIGILCDKTRSRYGRRKTWHMIGTILVAISLFFFWHTCLPCSPSTPLALKIFYFAIPICIFQFGWASVQISHLSLIPELTSDENERVGLNAIRYAFTILSNIGVFTALFLLLEFVHVGPYPPSNTNSGITLLTSGRNSSTISPSDLWIFSGTSLGIIVVGLCFAAFFHIFTREPTTSAQQKEETAEGKRIPWYKWFANPQFYAVALVYMSTRLIVNLTQVYTPLYLVDSLKLKKNSVAIGPLVIYVSGLLMTLLLTVLNKFIGRYMVYFFGLALVWGGLIWFWVQDPPHNLAMNILLYGSTVLIGAGGSILLVTSLSMVADLIGCMVGSSAFVYGLMSFTDKLSNGVTIQVIQALHPCRGSGEEVCCAGCAGYYRSALVYVPGGASMLAVIGLACLTAIIYWRSRKCKDVSPICPSPKDASASYAISRDIDSGYAAGFQGEKKPLLH